MGPPDRGDVPSSQRTLRVETLARVEGEGAMHVEIVDGQVRDVALRIYEPPRFFEAFLRGRGFTEPPDITARICGICPVAYQTSACNALERVCGVELPAPLRALRRLMYLGEWIESHTLHVYMLHAPDFLGYDGALEMAEDARDTVVRGLALKKAGNHLVEVIGGRAIHPVNVRVGGFYRAPTVAELRALVPELEQARDDALATVRWVGGFDFPDYEGDWELVALREPDHYGIIDGRVVTSGGLEFDADAFDEHITEHHVERSTALHAELVGRGPYLVGPLARFNLNFDQLSASTRSAAREVGCEPACRNPFRSIIVRALEVLHATDEALTLIEGYEEPDAPAVPVEARPGTGCGWSEAPRGMLWHSYTIGEDGSIRAARIVPPTSQNQRAIEHDLLGVVQANVDLADDALRRRAEQTIRNYDPCISCSTHFLELTVDRR